MCTVTRSNYYCANSGCRRTTVHLCVKMEQRKYLYCVECGRRLEVRSPRPAERDDPEGCIAAPHRTAARRTDSRQGRLSLTRRLPLRWQSVRKRVEPSASATASPS